MKKYKNIDYEIEQTLKEAEEILKPKPWLLPPMGFSGNRTISENLRRKLILGILKLK